MMQRKRKKEEILLYLPQNNQKFIDKDDDGVAVAGWMDDWMKVRYLI